MTSTRVPEVGLHRTPQHERQWYAELGQRLRAERYRRGWTIYDLAAVVGRSGMWVSAVERGLRRMKAYDYHRLVQEGLL